MSGIAVRGLTKRWGDVVALAGIDFDARVGELLVLLGPSGCGKSTTLRIIAGLDDASEGTIRLGDRDVGNLPSSQRGISMVFQSYALFPHLSVRENIVFGLKVRRIEPTERERRLSRAAEMLGIGALLERKPAQLSGGQKQRVALGRAIVAEAPICLMDEPLSNLDAQLRQEMRGEIRVLQQRLGVTMIYVTHDQTEAMTMADQIILLRDGRIEQRGTAHDLYMRPQTSFTARFIGTPPMNLLRLDSNELRAAIETSLGVSSLAATTKAHELGLRPEAVRVAADGLPATVAAVEYLGAESIVIFDVAGQRLAARVPGGDAPAVGSTVRLTWDVEDMHLFATDGSRIDPVRLEHAA
jgi:sn-glycerol 3-phosphate transport system ATP-binding protein